MEEVQSKKQSKWAWTLTIIVSVLAVLCVVIGIFGLIDGYDTRDLDRVLWLSITSVVLGAIIAALAWLTFSQKVSSRVAWAWMQVIWSLCSLGLIVVGILGTLYIKDKSGLFWLPICITINGGLILLDKINYLINHFVRITNQTPHL